MSLSDEVLRKLEDEIINDPLGMGYVGKKADEVVKLLNDPVIKRRIVEDLYPSRINTILIGIAGTPNIVQESDILKSAIIAEKVV